MKQRLWDRYHLRRCVVYLASLALLGSLGLSGSLLLGAAENDASVSRMLADVQFLASDELEGRGVGTEGLNRAAQYIAEQFAAAGLRTQATPEGPFQEFSMAVGAELGEPNRAVIHGPSGEEIELESGRDFIPLSFGGDGAFEGPLVFAGYGITAEELSYDDYAGLEVEDKVVIVLRHEPEQDNPHSNFNSTSNSRYASLISKASNAYQHGARAVMFVTDRFSVQRDAKASRKELREVLSEIEAERKALESLPMDDVVGIGDVKQKLEQAGRRLTDAARDLKADPDSLLRFGYGGFSRSRMMPLLHVKGAVADQIVAAALGKDLAAIEEAIDVDLQPQSAPLEGWHVEGEITIDHTEANLKNVAAVLEGQGPLADETLVVGAHYDHLGYGGAGSLAHGSKEIHNGADDNASGTAGILELARRLAARPERLARRVVFIAFTAEEQGLIGSSHYVREPLFDLEDTVAMVNLDMIGRLRDNELTVFGTGTAEQFDQLVSDLAAEHDLDITKNPGGFGPSDHSSFYAKKVPVLHLFTGTHSDYHKPSDDWEKVNIDGARRIVDFLEDVVVAVADAPERPQYASVASKPRPRGGDRPYFGSIPDFGGQAEGYALQGVTEGSPAERAGLKGGDVIVRLGNRKIGNLEDFDLALRAHKAGDGVKVRVRRDGEDLTFKVVLDPPR